MLKTHLSTKCVRLTACMPNNNHEKRQSAEHSVVLTGAEEAERARVSGTAPVARLVKQPSFPAVPCQQHQGHGFHFQGRAPTLMKYQAHLCRAWRSLRTNLFFSCERKNVNESYVYIKKMGKFPLRADVQIVALHPHLCTINGKRLHFNLIVYPLLNYSCHQHTHTF